uniref:Uncharacterized protein n=1 Tax=Talaromyces marneffei PM1 TaxID=1077442 RepID=A0A093UX13_TALMA
MSTRALTSVPITNSTLIRSRNSVRLVRCSAVASIHAIPCSPIQVRMFWGRGWKYAWYHNRHNRVDRKEVLHDLAKDYRGQYVLIKRMVSRRPGQQRFWKNWNDSLKQFHRERDDIWRDSRRHRNYWDGDLSELVKKIERDPYNFLFGRSNESETGYVCGARALSEEHSVDVPPKTSTEKADDDVVTIKAYKPSDINGLHYDPISGRMKPVEQPATEVVRDETKDDSGVTNIPVKAFTGGANYDNTKVLEQESPKLKDTVAPTQDARSQVIKENVFYMAGPTEDSAMTLTDTSSTSTPKLQPLKDAPNTQKKKLLYEPKEITEGDVDLLCASDIRASFFAGETKQALAEKKMQARKAMEKDYFLAINTRRFINEAQLLANDIQKSCERVEATANTSLDTLRILAVDSGSSRVVCAETTSSMHANEPIRHASDVLLHLNNPAKFLPYFPKMKEDGYEIVSGGGDILIFRKMVTNGSESTMTGSADIERLTLLKDDKAGSSTDTLFSRDSYSSSQPSTGKDRSDSRIVHRQETIFTGGPPNWSPYHPPSSSNPPTSSAAEEPEYTQAEPSTRSSTASRLGKGLRRIVLSGVATAGTFYAIGVVCEYFLTGGQDGLGPEGFTEFEAERRRRE